MGKSKKFIPPEIKSVVAEYDEGILGGQGGVEVTICKMVQLFTDRPARPEISRIWIWANKEDCPEKVHLI